MTLDVDTFQSHEVDKAIKEQKQQDALNFKLLCLGAGEGGKSTIVKQLSFLHSKKAQRQERMVYVSVLHGNAIQCMATLVRECENFGYDVDMSDEQTAAADATRAIAQDTSFVLDPFTAADVHLLWSSAPIQKTWARRSEFWHLENSEYYFDHAARFAEPDFEPTEEDMVMARKRTTGVQVTDFAASGLHWSVVDVGGQRSERRKWIHCFDNVKAILFVVNLLEYVNVLFEDKAVNRMHESLELFEKLMKEPVFAETPVFLCLNKKDLFERELERRGIECCFPDYTGPQQLQPSVNYIAEQFQARLPAGRARAVVHLMAARVRKDVQYTFDEIKSYLVALNRKSLQKAVKHSPNPNLLQNTINTALHLHSNINEGEKRRRGSSDAHPNTVNNNNTNNGNNSTTTTNQRKCATVDENKEEKQSPQVHEPDDTDKEMDGAGDIPEEKEDKKVIEQQQEQPQSQEQNSSSEAMQQQLQQEQEPEQPPQDTPSAQTEDNADASGDTPDSTEASDE